MDIGRGGLYLRGVSPRALVLYLRLCADADAQGRGAWSEHIRSGLGERHTVDRCVRELEDAHYLERQQARQGGGRFARTSYRVIPPAVMAVSTDDLRAADERYHLWLASPARADLAGHSRDCTEVLDGVAGELGTDVLEHVARRCLAASVTSVPEPSAQVARVVNILIRMQETSHGIRSIRGAVEHAWTQVCGRSPVGDRRNEDKGAAQGEDGTDPIPERSPLSADSPEAFGQEGSEEAPELVCEFALSDEEIECLIAAIPPREELSEGDLAEMLAAHVPEDWDATVHDLPVLEGEEPLTPPDDDVDLEDALAAALYRLLDEEGSGSDTPGEF